ncbi:Gfo/Idh/MocA family protein [Geochorda subterranea]|uniref:Gfo/Idh/MocA family oxidoreductase n=1 Tax=Geochorda subterranea TaxID=3109564 RepID=A0ABZ1BUG7_9FIRM|nr:Gfo/Idh/MocA family oxidoreductase [Limnochorda sp. LNt]WRP15808.1 Gfo/Idh/MocA family oxidoreductase [Limnochorda sp. LNt]
MQDVVTLAIVGAGNRGADVYARYALEHPNEARVVAVADPDRARRDALGDAHGIPPEHRYPSWQELLERPRLADAVVIATPDRLHVEPALRAIELGYDILLEKPIAPTAEGVRRVAEAERRSRERGGGGSVTVAHVLRYTPFFSTIKRLLDVGRIGDLVSVQYTENVGYWHFAHSFVRGNWRNTATSSPMILAKSCHDMDMLRWLVGRPWRQISSFGSLVHFRPENAPPGAPARCTDGCPAADRCPFDAVRFYVQEMRDSNDWPVSVITRDFSPEGRLAALRTGPYGRCVYRCDNDVVDHQVVAIEFEGGVTAAFTMCGFTEENTRTLKLMGTRGEIRGHLEKGEIEVRSFVTTGAAGPVHEVMRVRGNGRHAGGDQGLMAAFIRRLRARKSGTVPEEALTSLQESLDSHFMAFAAEQSRLQGTVVKP